MDFNEYVRAAVEVAMREDQRRVEDACVRSLALDMGVLVVRKGGRVVFADPHPDVPPMEIHERVDAL